LAEAAVESLGAIAKGITKAELDARGETTLTLIERFVTAAARQLVNDRVSPSDA
jgi:hypothetical protein